MVLSKGFLIHHPRGMAIAIAPTSFKGASDSSMSKITIRGADIEMKIAKQ